MFRSLGYRVTQEPRSYEPGDGRFEESAEATTDRRPDLHVTAPATGESTLIDVTVTANTNRTAAGMAVRDPTAVLAAAARRKLATYTAAPNTSDLVGEVVPFVMSSTGVIGAEGLGVMARLAQPVMDGLDSVAERRWRFYWSSLLAESCAKGLASQLLAQTAHLEARAKRLGLAAEAAVRARR